MEASFYLHPENIESSMIMAQEFEWSEFTEAYFEKVDDYPHLLMPTLHWKNTQRKRWLYWELTTAIWLMMTWSVQKRLVGFL